MLQQIGPLFFELNNNNSIKDKVLPSVINFNPYLPNVCSIIKDNLNMLPSTSLLREIFLDHWVIPVYRAKNLNQISAPLNYKPDKFIVKY